jgi:uncharacterized protein involved in response to NO
MDLNQSAAAKIQVRDLAGEPFRLFFPAAILAGLLGVAVWPLHFAGVLELYPGGSHARLMAHGFFGGFIFGFLGTALPRLLSAPRFTLIEVALFLGLHAAMAVAHGLGWNATGDALFAGLVAAFAVAAGFRLVRRRDVPPPGFVLVPLAFACALAGAVISLLERRSELPFSWLMLRPLVYYQGFVLLPILGVGGFILPRFFGLASRQDFPEAQSPPPGWLNQAAWVLAVGLGVVGSFGVEAAGWPRTGHGLRLCLCAGWLLHQVPVHRSAVRANALATALKIAFGLLLLGIVAVTLFPGQRVALLHLTLVGGFGVIALTVATRVVFGHSGQAARLGARNRWLIAAVVLMLIGMATRVSGDFWPHILVSHYNYGALFWSAGVVLWAVYVLALVLVVEREG